MCAGCVICKTPVGDKVAQLKPEIWNAKWQGGGIGIVTTKIKDPKLGLVELTGRQPFPKLDHITITLLLRNLGPLLIVNQFTGDQPAGYKFGRVSIDGDHFVIFDENDAAVQKLVQHHELAGKFAKDEYGKLTGTCILDHFSDRDYLRLKAEGFDVRSLFHDDPDFVLVRYKWRLF